MLIAFIDGNLRLRKRIDTDLTGVSVSKAHFGSLLTFYCSVFSNLVYIDWQQICDKNVLFSMCS